MIGWQPARMVGLALLGAAALSFSPNRAEAQIPCSYSVTIQPDVDCGVFQAAGKPAAVSNTDTVVGTFIQCSGSYTDSFHWAGGPTLTVISKPSWMDSFEAADINDNGLIVGTAATDWAGQRAFIYNLKSGEWIELPPVIADGVGWSSANAISNSGKVCGYRSIGNSVTPYNAYIYDIATGTFTDLGVMSGPLSAATDITEGGAVCGWTGTQINTVGFLWADGKLTVIGPVPGGTRSKCNGLNDKLAMVGTGDSIPFMYVDGAFELLPPLGGLHTAGAAIDISNDGLIIGASRRPDASDWVGCLWFDGAVYDVNSLLEPGAGIVVDLPLAMNSNGSIVGLGKTVGGGQPIAIQLHPKDAIPGDVDCDRQVNVADLLILIQHWGLRYSPADFNHDSVVNVLDLLIVIQNWTVLP